MYYLLLLPCMLVTLTVAATAYAYWRALRRPPYHIASFARQPRTPGQRRIVCAGDSLIQGTISFDILHALRQELDPSVQLLNAGLNGDLAFNLAQRLPQIISTDPDDILLLIGTNDICGEQTPAVGRRQQFLKGLPERPTQSFFEQQFTRILRQLRDHTRARLLVVTPPLLGEDLSHPVHARLLRYAKRITEIAHAHGARVIPFHHAMAQALQASGRPPRAGFYPGPRELSWILLLPFQRYLLGMSFDRIARSHRLWGSPDLIHLNETSGNLLVALLKQHLQSGMVVPATTPQPQLPSVS